jgi:hypothetical protein
MPNPKHSALEDTRAGFKPVIADPTLPHQIRLLNYTAGHQLLVTCNCDMPKVEFSPTVPKDYLDKYTTWHKEQGIDPSNI